MTLWSVWQVISADSFGTALSQHSLCRVLQSGMLKVRRERELYDAVLRWGKAQLALGEAGGEARPAVTLAQAVAAPLRLVRYALIPPRDLLAIHNEGLADVGMVMEGLVF